MLNSESGEFKSPHARYAAHTARVLGHGFRSLDGADGYLFEVSDGARRAHFSAGAGTPYALNRAQAHAIARDKAFAQTVLSEHDMPTIPSRLFFTNPAQAHLRSPGREPANARAFAREATYPLFAKPIDGARGVFAEPIADAAQFDAYLTRVAPAHYAILVQPLIQAPEYRVFVLQSRVLFSYRKRPAHAIGPANRAQGGSSEDFRDGAAPHLAELAFKAAAALKLELAAIDIFDRAEGPLIIEANANPAIETLEDVGRWDLIETIWRSNFEAALR